jgi:enoyl-CoA hydratase/carnithine racemase
MDAATYSPSHFLWSYRLGVGTITLNRPERKNPLTFDSYHELTALFHTLCDSGEVKAVILTGAGDNFSSGGDVLDIIGPLVGMDMPDLLKFTRMTGGLVKAMRACPQPIIAAIDGICMGAGAIMAMASDLRYATQQAKTAFLFNRVGLAGCDMGACAILPRIIGQGRASDLLFSGRTLGAEEGERWGFYNRLIEQDALMPEAIKMAARLAAGPTFANAMTKNQLNMEWDMSLDTAIEAEAQAQAICMQTKDFARAYKAFVNKEKPTFEGN